MTLRLVTLWSWLRYSVALLRLITRVWRIPTEYKLTRTMQSKLKHNYSEDNLLPTFFRVLGFFDFVISRSRIFLARAAASSIAADCATVYTHVTPIHNSHWLMYAQPCMYTLKMHLCQMCDSCRLILRHACNCNTSEALKKLSHCNIMRLIPYICRFHFTR